MKLSNELLEKAKSARTAEELLEMAKAENVELTENEAERAIERFSKTGEISDDELDNVAGGCGSDEIVVAPKFEVGDLVSTPEGGFYCGDCRRRTEYVVIDVLGGPENDQALQAYRIACYHCKTEWPVPYYEYGMIPAH